MEYCPPSVPVSCVPNKVHFHGDMLFLIFRETQSGDLELSGLTHHRVVKHWNRFPREVAHAPSLPVIKRHLDNAPNNIL